MKRYSELFKDKGYPILISSSQNIFYISGFSTTAKRPAQIGPNCLLMFPEKTFFIIPLNWQSYIEDDIKKNPISLGDIQLIPYTEGITGLAKQISNLLTDSFKNRQILGFEKDGMELELYLELTEQFKHFIKPIQWQDISLSLKQARKRKSPEEIQALRDSARIACNAMEEIRGKIRPGTTELELTAELEYSMRKNGSDGVPFTAKVLSGENAVRTVNLPSNRIIQEYDMVLLDFGATVNGYASDWTRTFAVGSARQEQLELYRLVWDIERFLIELIRPGITFYQLFDRAYQILEGHTYAQWFHPYLGHSIGICSQEYPPIIPESEEILEENMVITVEPGIYIPGVGGLRIEDEVLVTANTHDILTGLQREEFVIKI